MLSKAEGEGCVKILLKLSNEEISSLLDTITSRAISVETLEEAIKVIVTFTSDPAELLKRKKIKRHILVAYLTEYLNERNEIGFKLPSSKKDLIVEILKRWGTDTTNLELMEIDDNSRDSDSFNNNSETSFEAPPPLFQQAHPHPLFQQDVHYTIQQHINVTNVNITSYHDHHATVETKSGGFDFKIFGEQFAKWFYENLNSFCPYLQQPNGDFGPHHFLDECRLVIRKWSPDPTREVLLNPISVSDKLLMFSRDEQLIFNPNLTSEGIFVKSNVHGLVEILVCGTLHHLNNCLGVFQQLFGLIKDPRYNDNWKIKTSHLFLKEIQSLTSIPKLEGNPEEQILAICND